jgi:hypothetical protein
MEYDKHCDPTPLHAESGDESPHSKMKSGEHLMFHRSLPVLLGLLLIAAAGHGAEAASAKAPIRVGIIGLDAHAVPWTEILANPKLTPPLSDMKVVAAVPAYSPDVPFSADNIRKNTQAMRGMGVEIVDTIEAMLPKVDAVMLLSIDGRTRLKQARPIFAARKPVFIDKPVAASLADVVRIYRLAAQSNTPVFSSSALRYAPGTAALGRASPIERVLGCDAYSSNEPLLPGHPDLFYYGIHGCEALFTIMGPGCKTVSRIKTPTADLAAGVWEDGRLGTFRGILRGQVGFGATAFGEHGIIQAGRFDGYEPLLVEIAKFFRSGKPPVRAEQTLEIYAFMEAADESKRRGGQPVSLESVLSAARKIADDALVDAASSRIQEAAGCRFYKEIQYGNRSSTSAAESSTRNCASRSTIACMCRWPFSAVAACGLPTPALVVNR